MKRSTKKARENRETAGKCNGLLIANWTSQSFYTPVNTKITLREVCYYTKWFWTTVCWFGRTICYRFLTRTCNVFGSLDAYSTAIILFCRCTFVQDTYQNLIYPVARQIYSSLRLPDIIIVPETVFYYYICPHMLILFNHFRFLCNFYDLV